MVNPRVWLLFVLLSPTCVALGDEVEPAKAVASALGKGAYPWYDPPRDRVKPMANPSTNSVQVQPSDSTASKATGRDLGSAISFGLFVVALGVLIGLLVWFWRTYQPDLEEDRSRPDRAGDAIRVEALPEGMRRDYAGDDPWSEALRRRAAGDLDGAIVCLFAHQLLTLSRLRLVRLAPGRTGRQLLVEPTLWLFEAVYYGHRATGRSEFDRAWASAEAFERRVAQGGEP
jgi:hypothetical protein